MKIWPTAATSSLYPPPPVIVKHRTPATPAPSEAGFSDNASGYSLITNSGIHIQSLSMPRPITPWSDLEDDVLKSLAEKYGNHWGLIHELFKSNKRVKTYGERDRGVWELVERYAQMVNAAPRTDADMTSNQPTSREGSVRAASVQASASTSAAIEEKGMKTRGVKRRATMSGSNPMNGSAGSPTPSGISVSATNGNGSSFRVSVVPGWDSRRRKRHLNIGEAIRKVIKKRDADAKTGKMMCLMSDLTRF